MKKIIALILLVSALTAHAQTDSNPLRALQEMQACRSNMSQEYRDRADQHAKATYIEIQRLCKAGQRDEAEATSQREAQKMMADPEHQEFLQCSSAFYALDEEDEDIHVCDDF